MSKDKIKKLNLPKDCEKLSIDACTNKLVKGRCKIKSSTLGLKSKCIPNEDYETDKFVTEQGFKNFARIDEDNLDEELHLRNELCSQLSVEQSCESLKGRALGCSVKGGFFGKKRCGLSKEIVDYFYRKRQDCVAVDCKEKRKKYNILCEEHYQEINELLQEYKMYYQNIMYERKNVDDSLFNFNDIYGYMQEIYSFYLLDRTSILNNIEEMKMRVDREIGQDQCQAYNISTCLGDGDVKRRCKNKGYIKKEGTFCLIHSGCYKDRLTKYKYIRDNLDKLCIKELCATQVNKLKVFWEMIRYTTEGDASIIKYEILETTEIIQEFSKL